MSDNIPSLFRLSYQLQIRADKIVAMGLDFGGPHQGRNLKSWTSLSRRLLVMERNPDEVAVDVGVVDVAVEAEVVEAELFQTVALWWWASTRATRRHAVTRMGPICVLRIRLVWK